MSQNHVDALVDRAPEQRPTARNAAQTSAAGNDRALVRRMCAGDERAFEDLVRQHGPRMLVVAKRLLRCDAEAADAVQEAFIAAHRALDRFEENSRLGTWLHRITINAALMRLRTRRRRGAISIDDLLPSFESGGHREVRRAAWSESAEALLERSETCALVRSRVDMLPEDHRTVLILRDIEQLDTEETAAVLEIRPGAVKTRLHRARMALRELLEREFA